jgi:4-amino-4-deoxy-L-arabinose transferase-like glycosyltransferase
MSSIASSLTAPEHFEAPARPGAPPGGGRAKRLLFAVAMVVVPALCWLLYYRLMFPGLTNPEAFDYAQLGRNLAAGRGFVTYLLRPLALTHGSNAIQQPDVTHGPLFPLLLALAFGALGAQDSVAAAVSGLFYLLTVPVICALGRRLFSPTVGWAAAMLFTLNALMLEYAVSGLPITLYIFLATSLMLVIYRLAAHGGSEAAGRLPRALLVLAGLLTAALYLTDPVFFWLILVVTGAVIALGSRRRAASTFCFVVPLGLLVLPWMLHNFALTGNPLFGLHTKGYYPGHLAYRLTPAEMSFGSGLIHAVLAKVALGSGKLIQTLPQMAGSWVLAFFLPALLFRFSDPAANTTRRVLVGGFVAVFGGVLLFGMEMPPFVAWLPATLVFSLAFLAVLLRQAQPGRPAMGAVAVLLTLTVAYPLAAQLGLDDRPRSAASKATALALRQASRPGDVCLSDQPWIVAWYADRPALWLPANDERLRDFRQQFATARWLFIAGDARNYSAEWRVLYDGMVQWNNRYLQAPVARQASLNGIPLAGKGMPLLEQLEGFAWLPPVKNAPATTVLAAAPPAGTGVGQGTTPIGPLASGAPSPGIPRAK